MTTKYYDIQILYEVMDTLLWRLWRDIFQERNKIKVLKHNKQKQAMQKQKYFNLLKKIKANNNK